MNAKEYLGQAYRLDQHINDRLCFMTWEQISLDMHYTNRWLRKMHERALDVVDRILLERSGSK